MPGDFDPRGLDTREREDGIHDREEQWLALGREHDLSSVREEPMDDDARARDGDWRDERDREPRDRDDDRGSLDPRDVFVRDLDLPDGRERELVHDRDRACTLSGKDTAEDSSHSDDAEAS